MAANLDLLQAIRGTGALRNVSTPDKPRGKSKGFGDLALRGAITLGRPFLSALGEVGEAFSAPGMALSEGYGAYEAGKPILKAAARGFTEPLEKARYPSFGERIVPEEEGEGLARKAGRLVAELATDPTMYVGPGAVKAVGKGVVKGAKFLAGTKAATALGKSKTGQAAARLLLPSVSNLRLFGEEGGQFVAKGSEATEKAFANITSRERLGVERMIKKLGLGGAKNEARQLKIADVIESGVKSGDSAVDEMADYIARRQQAIGQEVESFRDVLGKGVNIRRPLTRQELKAIKDHGVALGLANPKKAIRPRDLRLAFEDLVRQGGFDRIAKGNVPARAFEGGWVGKRAGKYWIDAPFEMIGAREGGIAGGKGWVGQFIKDEFVQAAMTKGGLGKTAENLARQFRISEKEAARLLKEETGRIKRAGHIEFSRQGNIPKEIVERNILKIFPRYVGEVTRRLEVGREFGLDLSLLEKNLDKAIKAGLSEKTAKTARQKLIGRQGESGWAEAVTPTLLALQTMTKMGPTSTIAQLSQSINTIVREGLGNFTKGLWRLSADPAVRERAITSVAAGVYSNLEHLIGKNGGRAMLGQYAGGKYLRFTGFTAGDWVSRVAAYSAGVPAMEERARKALKAGLGLTDELEKAGLMAADLAEFAAKGKFGVEAETKIGEAAWTATQFTTRWTDLPPMWQSPAMKLATQFKSFIHQQTRFLVRDVVQPAAKYFETGGKEGNIGPLMRALVAYPVAGQGVAALRDLLHEQSAKALGAKRREPRKFDYNHPVAQMLEDSFYVGAFGLGGDVLQQAARGRLIPWGAGPTISDVAENVEFVARHAAAGKLPKAEALLSRLYRHVPGRRVLPLEPGEAAGAISRAFR